MDNWHYCKHCGERTLNTKDICLKCQSEGKNETGI